jgi:phospholipid transport system substrate-binding protein
MEKWNMILAFRRQAIAIICLVGGLSSVMAAPLPPDQLVKQTIDEVLSIIRSDEKIKSGDVARVAEVMEEKIAPHFDFPRMTRLAVGRPWRQATPEQRKALVNEFHTLLIRSYASAFTLFNAIYIEYRPLRKSDEETEATVNTLIRLPGGAQPITVDYEMKLKDDAWQVYDVSVGGASMIINYRNLFSQEIQRGGLDGLLNSLVEKNSGNLSTATGKQ